MEGISLTERALPPVHIPPEDNFPRISQTGFIVSIFVFLAIAIIGSVGRVIARIWQRHSFSVDDGFLLLSLVALSACCACMYEIRDSLFIQIYVSLGVIPFPKDTDLLLQYHRILQAASVLQWVSLFAAKFSLLWFFRKLVNRVAALELWWKIVTVLVACLACVVIPLGFSVCTDFQVTFLQTCSASTIAGRESIYTDISVTFDILSDVLVLSVPLFLLWKVQIELRRKIALASILCLSVFMIIIAIVRVAASTVGPPGKPGVADTVWLFFWQTLEAAIAVIMVALTGLPSLLSPVGTKNGGSGSRQYANSRSGLARSGFSRNKNLNSSDDYEDAIGLRNTAAVGPYTNLESFEERETMKNLPGGRIVVTNEYNVQHSSM